MKARKIKSKELRSNSLEMMNVFITHLENIQKLFTVAKFGCLESFANGHTNLRLMSLLKPCLCEGISVEAEEESIVKSPGCEFAL